MVDQSQQSPFVGSYGQLRLAAVVPSKTSTQQNIEGNQPAKGAAQVPTGVDPKTTAPGVKASTKSKTTGVDPNDAAGGSILPYLLGPAGLAAGAGAAKMALDRYSKGQVGDAVDPSMIDPRAGTYGVPSTEGEMLNWRYADRAPDPSQVGGGSYPSLTNGQTTQPNGAGLNYNPRGQGQSYMPQTPDVIAGGGAPQLALPNPNANPNGAPIYAGQGDQPLMLTDQNAAGRAKAAEFARQAVAARLGSKFKVTAPEINSISRLIK